MIGDIAFKINKLSHNYQIGNLQEIRKNLKGFSRRPGSDIFADASINEDWAFHFGGRKELQFNIGYEDEGLRYGIAFSLEASQTLPDISKLFPKILKFNQFIRENPQFFEKYSMWYYQNGERSAISSVVEIPPNLLQSRTFIFIGKLIQENEGIYPEILATFDELLTSYIYVEKEKTSGVIEFEQTHFEPVFTFEVKARQLPKSREYSLQEKSVNLEVRHTLIQIKLIELLSAEWGSDNVSAEQSIFGKKIDVVLMRKEEFDFYEIKTCGSAKACIREAIGQLLEYAYWPACENAKNLIVIGEEPIDNRTAKYLEYKGNRFRIPVKYQHVPI